jgi:hypothetical protein
MFTCQSKTDVSEFDNTGYIIGYFFNVYNKEFTKTISFSYETDSKTRQK